MPRFESSDDQISEKAIKFVLVLLLAVLPIIAFSQVAEICDNGIDDDHDGFIDCYDGSCANSPVCDGLFLGNDATCQAIPPQFPKFTMAVDFSSPNETTNHLARMVIGDYDRDGIPEIATMNRYTNTLFILRGNNGAIKYQKTVTFEPRWEIATANIDNDNCAELFYIGYLPEISHTEKINGKKVTIIDQIEGIYMFAYDCQLNFIWRTVEPFPNNNDPINYGVADFDGDGLVEIYAKDEIYDAKTGMRLIKSTAADYQEINGGPVAVNMQGDSRLELVIGLAIYDVDLTNRTLDNGKLTLLQGRNDYFIRYEYNATSVADYNLDGFLDVIASGSTIAHGKNTTVFFWDVKNNTVKTYSDPQPGLGSDYKNGWMNGTGRLNIADLDGDGKMNVSYVSGRFLYALNENFGLFWRAQINEETSGYTGCTLFDFNGDGKAEIVYRDERYLYIINGTDGTNYQNPQTCISRTNREYPIVADVDADGSTEICVTCGFNDASAAANFNTLSYSQYSHVRVFKSAAEPWVPARRIWNQHGYFIVNVNDDLTIPKVMQPHHLVWSTGSCTAGPNRPLNKFLNQSPFLNSKGCPTYAAVNLTFSSIKPKITPPQCPDVNFTVSMQITNLGDVSLTGTVPISFYTSNPKRAGATKLTTTNVTLNDLRTNQTFDINNLAINGNGSDSLYLVLNDAGTTVPTPISLPNGTFFECDYTDNVIGAGMNPLPVTLTALQVNPNDACINPANGAARAFVPNAGGIENTTDYNFYWFNGAVAKPIASANFVGPIYSGIPNGTYTVYARHKTSGCSSDTLQVVVGVIPGVPAVNVTVISDQTSCTPPNGQLSALVVGGNTGFTFSWFDISLTPLGITTPVANGLSAGTYVVFASRNGCSKSSAPVTIAGPPVPDAAGTVLANITDCSNPNTGSIKADALIGGVVQNPANYTFDWYFYNNATSTRGSILPAANGTGQTRTGLAAGYYQAVVKEVASQCVSPFAPVVQVVNQTAVPTATINQVAPQTSCDPANPNGILSADALIGGVVQNPAAFTFEWFKGDNTLPANLHTFTSGTNGQVANKVAGGGVFYTVRVTSANHCSATNKFIIGENINSPVVALAATNNSICDPVLAGTAYNGAVNATVTFAGAPVSTFTNYKFVWHGGPLITDPVIAVANNQLPSLGSLNGGYYTVEVQRTDLGCNAVPVTVQVLNTPAVPVIVTNNTPSTQCTGTPNGILDAKVDLGAGVTTTTGYTFKWFKGNTIAGLLVGATPNVTGQQGGQNFTVQVINSSSGCTNTLTITLPDASALPVITLSPSPNSVCDPALTSPAINFNGSVTAAATYKGVPVGSFADYSFTWHNGSLVTDPVNGSSTSQNLSAVNSGFYTATATIVSLGCTSSAVTSQVLNTKILPVITTATVASTNCDPLLKNGQASVTDVDGAGIGVPYNFKWYDGVSVVAGSEKSLTAVYSNAQGGAGQNYTVLVTNQSSGCQNNKTVQVADAKVLPVITLSKTDNSRCIIPNDGSATLNTLTYQALPIASPYAGYAFSWNTGATTSTISGLAAATYTLSVTKTSVGCTSSTVSVAVNDNLFIPVINVSKTAQTSCDVANPNGIVAATIDETSIGGGAAVTAGYNFVWHVGTQLTDPTVATTGVPGQVIQLNGNLNYIVEATHTSSGCKNTSSVFLPETVVLPAVTFTTVTPFTRCDTPNGSILTTVTQIPVQTYTYFWLKESTSLATNNSNTVITTVNGSPAFPNRKITGPVAGNTDTFGNLIPGDYTIVVVDNYTTCVSQPVTGTVLDNSSKSVITMTLGPTFPSACGTSDGQMSASVAGGIGPYDLQWHKTGPINSNINFFNNPPQFTPPNDVPFQTNLGVTSATANNLASGAFTLVIKDDGNGCQNYASVSLPFLAAHTITPTLTPSTVCPNAAGNGNIKVTVGNIPGGKTFQDFTYVLYAGENPDPANQVGAVLGPGAAVTNPENFPSLLPSGKYTIEVRQAFAGLCPTFQVVEILQNALTPDVTLVGALQANTACDPLQANGAAVIDIEKDPADLTAGSTYTLDVSPLPVGGGYPIAGLGTGNQTITGLKPSGTVSQYTVTITSTNNCITQRFISIPDRPAVAQLLSNNITVTDAPLCSPSGSLEVTAINITGVGADNLNSFRFDWFSDIGLTTNIFSAQGDNTAVKGGEFLDNTTFAGIGPGSFWVTATKTVPGQPGSGCTSAPFKSEINDISVHPVIVMNAFTNTACDTNYEGRLTLQVSDPSGPGAGKLYTYVWDPSNPIAIPSTNNNNGNSVNDGDGDNPTNLKEGTYKVTATNNFTACVNTAQVSLLKATTPIVVASGTAVDKQFCVPDGSVTIGANDVTVNGAVDPVHGNFVFDWFLNSSTGPIVLTGTAADVINNVTYPAILAGDYYVTVTRGVGVPSGSGCTSAPLKKTILDNTISPVVSFATVANTVCDNNFDAKITVLSSTPSGPGSAATYDIAWTAFSAGSTVANATNVGGSYTTTAPDVVAPGSFSVSVTNRITKCLTTGLVSVLSNPQPVDISTVNKADQAICYPDGNIAVASLNSGAPANYAYNWFLNSPAAPPLVDAGGTTIVTPTLSVANYPTIGAGTYFVVATKNNGPTTGSGCSTPPFRVDILDNHQDPRVQLSYAPNSSCDNLNPNGAVLANAAEQSGANGDTYSFAWTLNGAALPGVTTQTNTNNSSQLGKGFEGTYQLTVLNVTTTGCQFTSSLNVDLNLNISLPNIIGISQVDPIDCFPSGSAQVTSVSIGGAPAVSGAALAASFSFQWYANNFIPANILPTTSPNIGGLSPISYFVLVQDNSTLCKSGPREVKILDTNIAYPVVTLTQTAKQISCIATSGTAALSASATEADGSIGTYNFTWYSSLDLTGPVISGPAAINPNAISNLVVGNYSIEVQNTATSCKASALYIVPDDVPQFKPNLALSSQPHTKCTSQDGFVVATVVGIDPAYPFPLSYTADLYFGANPNLGGPPDIPSIGNIPGFTTSFVASAVPDGTYTVRVTDNNTSCTAVDKVAILDERKYPVPAVSKIVPNVNCDPANANGLADALVDGTFVGYQFDWYQGVSASGIPLYTGAEFGKLNSGDYTVQATDLLTGCTGTVKTTIPDGRLPIPSPDILKLSDVTSCVTDNGSLSASVGQDKNTKDYVFNWYNGKSETPSSDFVGEIYSDLAAATYSVTATSKLTGCKSPLTSEVINKAPLYPDFDFKVQNPSCGNNNGFATLIMIANVPVERIEWANGTGPFEVGPNLVDVVAGTYTVTVTSDLGCATTKDVDLLPEVRPFNGISRNRDGQNDFFQIDCIQDFPNNIVKIYNRAGTLVFEAVGYDNISVYFDGQSNKGVSIMGTHLPDGTYFYIVDKRNGTKPIAGYLEIVD